MENILNRNKQLKYGIFVASLILVCAILNYFSKFIFIFGVFNLLQIIILFVFVYMQVEIFDLYKKSITNKIIFAIITYIPVIISYIFVIYLNFWNPFELVNKVNLVGTFAIFNQVANLYFVNVILILFLIVIASLIEEKYPVSKLFRGLQEYIQRFKLFIKK